MSQETIKGARIVLETLHRLGVTDMFGYPGGAVIPIFDEIYSFPEIKHYFVRHEQGAAHAADAYARVSGKVGVCLATSGPGATNLVTGLMTAYMDSVPMIAITGQVGRMLIGKDSFQEADIQGITMPITKHNYLVQDIKDLPRIIKEAYHIASTGRPGPVLIDIPKDIQTTSIPMDEYNTLYSAPIHLEGYTTEWPNHVAQVEEAAALIKAAKKPMIIAGGGSIRSGAAEALKALAEKTQIPVATTLMGLGAFSSDHDQALGFIGMHGTVASNFASEEADLVIAAGIRFHDRYTGLPSKFLPKAKVIQIDIDPAEMNKNCAVDLPIVGDLKEVLSDLTSLVEAGQHQDWLTQIKAWKEEYPMEVPPAMDDRLMPQAVLEAVDQVLKGEAIVVTDVGQHQMWAAQYLTCKAPKTWCTSGGAGTMGYGLPAAMGAAVAAPHKTILLIVGDGGFQMTSEELMMMSQYDLNVKIVLINNGYLGMVRQWQELFNDRRYSFVDLAVSPDFNKLAEAYSIPSAKIESQADLALLPSLLTEGRGVLINCLVSREANVLPMIPAGKNVPDMMGHKGVLDHE